MSDQRHLVAYVSGQRLDVFLHLHYPDLTRSRLQHLIQRGWVTVNQRPLKPSYNVQSGDVIHLTLPPPQPMELVPQPIPLQVHYQDEQVLVVDKPAGLTVHPGPGHTAHTLVNALLALCPDLQGVGDEVRPGIVHRLDKDTSGLMVVAKTEGAFMELTRQWKGRQVLKGYLALVHGEPRPWEGHIDAPIARHPRHRQRMAVVQGGRSALTRYRILKALDWCTLLEALPETGRTHQIRVHLASIGHPIVGDLVYGKRSPHLKRQFLHAHRLGFRLPASGEYREFTSELPQELTSVLELLERGTPRP